jgi:metal-sulfur cluster biosynthetic enzyme
MTAPFFLFLYVFPVVSKNRRAVLKKFLQQTLIVILLISIIWLFKLLPGWLIEREMKKQLSMIEPGPRTLHTEIPAEPEKKSEPAKPIPAEQIYETLKFVKDPEIDISVVDLGLIHHIRSDEKGIRVTMILTRRFCPYQAELVSGVKAAVKKAAPARTVTVIVDYSKTWTFSDLTADGKKQWEKFFGERGDD